MLDRSEAEMLAASRLPSALTLLDADRRPTVVIPMFAWESDAIDHRLPIFANNALRRLPATLRALNAELSDNTSEPKAITSKFRSWISHCVALSQTLVLSPITLCDMLWDFCSSSDEWLIISARIDSKPPGQSKIAFGPRKDAINNTTADLEMSSQARSPASHERHALIAAAGTDTELLRRIAQLRYVGMILTDPEGQIIFANEYWYELTQHPREDRTPFAWLQHFEDEEVPRLMKLWEDHIGKSIVVTYSAKLKRRWKPPPEFADAGDQEPVWLQGSGHANVEDGITVGATGCLIEISSQKWLEKKQQMMLDQANDRIHLSEQITMKTLEATTHEQRFRKLADDVAVGIYIADSNATISYANAQYWALLGIDANRNSPRIWEEAMEADQLAKAALGFRKVYEEKVPVTGIEIKLKRRFDPIATDYGRSTSSKGNLTHQAWVLFQAFPELDSDGRVAQVVGCMTDISHQKWVEEFQSKQKEDAISARLEQEKFMDMTSHEMRNPLSAVIHCSDEILEIMSQTQQETMTPKQAHQYGDIISAARTILTCSQHARRIMDDVLTFSKMRSRLLEIRPVPCRPVEVLRSAMNIFQGDAQASAASLELNFDESVERLKIDWTLLDQGRFFQVLTNLITNSLKFVRGQPTRSVKVSMVAALDTAQLKLPANFNFLDHEGVRRGSWDRLYQQDDDTVFVQVIVDDTGCGIPAEEQSKLFGRFFQASHKTHTQYGGSGLGLLISKQLCELQGGQIGFTSTPDVGSLFSFFVKTTRCQPPVDQSNTVSSSKAAQPFANHANMRYGPGKVGNARVSDMHSQGLDILLVEDNLTNQKVLKRQLERHGHRVEIANNGIEALAAIKKTQHWLGNNAVESINNEHGVATSALAVSSQHLSLILLDVEMPVMDGLTCIRHIRTLEREGLISGHIPVVAVTANARREQMQQAVAAGMDDVLCKPFQIKELLQVVQKLMHT